MPGRNEPCPCGSNLKYKRCCGANAAPKLAHPEVASPQVPGDAFTPGLDPSQFDPQMLATLTDQFKRLPKGQLQRLQAMTQKAMSGKDVSQDMETLTTGLPMELQEMLFSMQAMQGTETLAGDATRAVESPVESPDAKPKSFLKKWFKK